MLPSSHNTAVSRTGTMPSVRGGLANARARSTSVTTGASSHSYDSSHRLHQKGEGDGDGDDDSVRTPASSVKGSKLKKFFGDDAHSSDQSSQQHVTDDLGSLKAPTMIKPVDEVPWFLDTDYAPQDLVLNDHHQVKGVTLGALIERLTLHNAFVDASFSTTFLMTYRSFTTTEEFVELLFARFRLKEPQGLTEEEREIWAQKKQSIVRLRVSTVLKSWLESHFYEGEDEKFLDRIEDFVSNEMANTGGLKHASALLLRSIERRRGKGEQKRKMVMTSSAPPSIVPRNLRKLKFLDIDPLEMARQLTLKDSALYNKIKPAECLGKAWSKSDGLTRAPSIREVISANNRLSGWVSEAILTQEDLKKRAAWVKQFVAVADVSPMTVDDVW